MTELSGLSGQWQAVEKSLFQKVGERMLSMLTHQTIEYGQIIFKTVPRGRFSPEPVLCIRRAVSLEEFRVVDTSIKQNLPIPELNNPNQYFVRVG